MSPGSRVVHRAATRGLPSLNSNRQACTQWSVTTLPAKVNFVKLRFANCPPWASHSTCPPSWRPQASTPLGNLQSFPFTALINNKNKLSQKQVE
ncbi:hypothetical protein E2C01_036169 [Portunus trituberculatus]|uniref:Uncharacterized protein n=1 Tax=Portunus trituberculatus TaxID=210409 RepID=A0A5B7FB63_PORTR|nr:hypothetical protein [Portunus trituberculatus]